jgi:hypothetical protein
MRVKLCGILLALSFSDAAAQATWVIERTPILDASGVASNSTVTFGNAAGGTRLSDGRLLIADRSENSIRIIDATGKLLQSVGRTGDGPGEFRSMVWAGRCGADSLLVWDYARRQATMIGSNGAIARQFAVPAVGDSALPAFQFSCSPRGAIAYRSAPRPSRGAMNPQNPNVIGVVAAVYRIRSDGSVAQRLGEIPAGEVVPMVSPSGGRGAAPRPLGRTSAVASLDDAVVISSADSASLAIVRGDGRASHHALPIVLRSPTREEFEEAIRATAAMAPAPAQQAMAEQLKTVPMPERLPAISGLSVDSEGLVWVQTTPPGAKTLDFLVMQSDGKVVARAQVPRGITVFEIGRDYVLGGYTDDGDEPHVVMYRLRRQ